MRLAGAFRRRGVVTGPQLEVFVRVFVRVGLGISYPFGRQVSASGNGADPKHLLQKFCLH
jgi:hypothetical protein